MVNENVPLSQPYPAISRARRYILPYSTQMTTSNRLPIQLPNVSSGFMECKLYPEAQSGSHRLGTQFKWNVFLRFCVRLPTIDESVLICREKPWRIDPPDRRIEVHVRTLRSKVRVPRSKKREVEKKYYSSPRNDLRQKVSLQLCRFSIKSCMLPLSGGRLPARRQPLPAVSPTGPLAVIPTPFDFAQDRLRGGIWLRADSIQRLRPDVSAALDMTSVIY
jgi:hypothetical protein